MKPQIQKIVVIGLIVNDKNEILLTQRLDPKIKDAHLKWDVPGGKSEFGESLSETLEREILEEIGIKVEVQELLPKCVSKYWDHEDYFQHTLLFCYKCKFIKGIPVSNDGKIGEIKWQKLNDALKMDLLSTTREFIEMI